ncbi:MAG: hypothetical protein KAI66_26475, partial [Lentisphaeria bacterium]|nr:hypothetical protein [Lentisphaeria bacterium]
LNSAYWIGDQTIYATNFLDGVVHAIEAKTGRGKWRFTAWAALSPPVVLPDRGWVCVANAFGDLLALRATDGQLLKHIAAPPELEAGWTERVPDIGLARQRESIVIDCTPEPGRRFVPRNRETVRRHSSWQQLHGSHSVDLTTFAVTSTSHRVQVTEVDTMKAQITDRTKSADARARLIANCVHSSDAEALLPTLSAILADSTESASVRGQAMWVLVRMCPAAAELLPLEALSGTSAELRTSASMILRNSAAVRESDTPMLLNHLSAIFAEGTGETRREALLCLLELGGVLAKPFVEDILADVTSPWRSITAIQLAEAGDRSVLPILREMYDNDVPSNTWRARPRERLRKLSLWGEPTARKAAIRAIHVEQVIDHARQAVERGERHTVWVETRPVLEQIRKTAPDPCFVPFLAQLLDLAGTSVTSEVVETLVAIGHSDCVPV